jgi:hypothetical protein
MSGLYSHGAASYGSEPGPGSAAVGDSKKLADLVALKAAVGQMRGVSGFGGGYQLCQPEGDAGAGGDHRRARDPASDLLRQRAGVLRPWGISTPVKVGSCRGIGG